MSPEAVGSLYGGRNRALREPMQASSDVYSLGIVAHQLLTGSFEPITCGEVGVVELSCRSYCSWWHGAGWNIR